MNYVYRFLDARNEVIYVGKTRSSLSDRFYRHKHLPVECYEMVNRIEYIDCPTPADMDIREIYYISKHKDNKPFFNLQDVSTPAALIQLDDVWQQYDGPLPETFLNSENYANWLGFEEPSTRYFSDDPRNWDIWPLNFDEVQLITSKLLDDISAAQNQNQRYIRFRNLLLCVVGFNLPLKAGELRKLRYSDFFDADDRVKPLTTKLTRAYRDKSVSIPQKSHVKMLLNVYREWSGLSFQQNCNDYLFYSRKGTAPIREDSMTRIVNTAAEAVGLEKKASTASFRKSFGANIYNKAEDKLEALLFLEMIFGQRQYGNIIQLLRLHEGKCDMPRYFGDEYALAVVSLPEIHQALLGQRPLVCPDQ